MLKIEKVEEKQVLTLVLEGEVDASNSVELDEAISSVLEAGVKKILVDGTSLEYISSAGLGVFMSYLEDFQERQIQLAIFGLNEKVMQVFRILGLDKLILIRATKEEILQDGHEA